MFTDVVVCTLPCTYSTHTILHRIHPTHKNANWRCYELFKNIQSQNTALSVGFYIKLSSKIYMYRMYSKIKIKHFHNIFKQKYFSGFSEMLFSFYTRSSSTLMAAELWLLLILLSLIDVMCIIFIYQQYTVVYTLKRDVWLKLDFLIYRHI